MHVKMSTFTVPENKQGISIKYKTDNLEMKNIFQNVLII